MPSPKQDACYSVRRNWGMRTAWCFVAVFMIGFGGVPWVILIVNLGGHVTIATHWPAILFMFGWSSLPWSGAAWLLFHSFARIEIIAFGHALVLIRTVGPFVRKKWFHHVDHIYYVRRWFHRKNGPDREGQCLFVRDQGKKKILLSDLESSDLTSVFEWLSHATPIDAVDWRARRVFG